MSFKPDVCGCKPKLFVSMVPSKYISDGSIMGLVQDVPVGGGVDVDSGGVAGILMIMGTTLLPSLDQS